MANGSAVEYDWLVLALGSDSVFFGIDGVKELCLPFNTYSDAMRVRSLFNANISLICYFFNGAGQPSTHTYTSHSWNVAARSTTFPGV